MGSHPTSLDNMLHRLAQSLPLVNRSVFDLENTRYNFTFCHPNADACAYLHGIDYTLHANPELLLRQELSLQHLSRLIGNVFWHRREGAAQAGALVLDRGVVGIDRLKSMQALEGREVLVYSRIYVSNCAR